MSMPKTSMDKYGSTVLWKDNIRGAGKMTVIDAVAKAYMPK